MPQPHRAPSLLLALLLPACGEEDPAAPDKETDPHEQGDDTGAAWGVVWSTPRVLDALPATLPAAEGGALSIRVAATSEADDGHETTAEERVAASTFAARLDDGTALETRARAEGDDQVVLSVQLPAGLPTGRRVVTVSADGAVFARVPVGAHRDLASSMAALTGTRSALLPGAADLQICSWAMADLDLDGAAEALVVGVDSDGLLVHRTCRGFLEEGREGWRCEDASIDAGLAEGEDLLCGETDHFRFLDGGTGVVTVAPTTAGRVLAIGPWSWSRDSWGGTSQVEEVTAVGVEGVVLGVNTTKVETSPPLSALLGLRWGGGRWDGVYSDGTTPREWARIGDTTADALGAGDAWAGLFTARDLRGGDGPDASWAWVVDPSGLGRGGDLVVNVVSWNSAVGAFVRVRDLQLPAPGFTPEHATAIGEDLDGDGVPELMVEAWGEGRHAAWLVPSATDKSATARPRTLLGAGDSLGDCAFVRDDSSVSVSGGSVVFSDSSALRLAGEGSLVLTTTHLPLDPAGLPTEEVVLASSFDLDEALAEAAVAVSPVAAGPVRATVPGGDGWVDTAVLASSGGTCSGRGACLRGRCSCTPGYRGRTARVLGSGEGSGDPWLSLAPGALAMLNEDAGGESLVLTRVPDPAEVAVELPLLALDDGAGGVSLLSGAIGADGPVLRQDGVDLGPWSPGGPVAMLAGPGGRRGLILTRWTHVAYTASAAEPSQATVVRADLRVRYADQTSAALSLPSETTTAGTTAPVVLGPRVSDEGGVLLGWRDGAGQAWLGVLDVATAAGMAEGELPFLQGPVAVGAPLVDPDGVLGLGTAVPGMVGLPADGGVLADEPLLEVGLETRDLGWDTPMGRAWTASAAPYGPGLVTVGDAVKIADVLYLPAFSDLTGLAPLPLYTELDLPDLPVPRLAAHLLPDAPPVVVSATARGVISLDLVDGTGPLARQSAYLAAACCYAGGLDIAVGDVNGDGLGDLFLPAGAGTQVFPSDGAGGVLDGGGEARVFTNFGVLLGGSTSGETAMDPAGVDWRLRGRGVDGLELLGAQQ